MDVKHFFKNTMNHIKEFWNKGIAQKVSRVTYDVTANLLLFFTVIITMVIIFGGGVGAGYFASLVKDEPLRSYDDMRRDIYNYEETSKLYFADNIYIGDIRSDLQRDEIDLDDISELVIQAVIATEDQEFYEHNGIVPKAIVRALYQDIASSDSRTGGSTLTQQLIKNQILTNEVSFERKAKEMVLAMRLENFFEKEEILEAYLNIIPYGREASGRNIAGIQTAARGVFGVDASDLTLPQAAYLAGIPQNPYAYTPFLQTGEVKSEDGLEPGIERMKTVLRRMYQNDFITENEYKTALNYDIVGDFVEKSNTPMEQYPAIVFELERRAKDIIMEIIANEDGYIMDDLLENEDLLEQYEILSDRALRMNGYNIHSTINKEMYDTMQKIVKNYEHFGPDRTFTTENADGETVQVTEQVESGVVLLENKTGRILSFVPGRNYSVTNQFNYATQAYRQPGSTFKPIAVYAPGMELGALQPGSVMADIPVTYPGGADGPYEPSNITKRTYGLVTAREALAQSYNISTVKFYNDIIGQNPGEKFIDKMNFSKITNAQTGNLSFGLGSMDSGVTVEENTNAFATFSNDGMFVESYMIEKITTSDGEVIYEHEPEPVEVFSPQTAYLTFDILRDVLSSGTATYLRTQLHNRGVDWAGKTGTSSFYYDGWYVGTNPNITLGSWIGYKTNSSIQCRGCSLTYHQRNMKLWTQIINELSEIDPDLITPKERLKQPDGIVSRSFCEISGLLPSEICKKIGLVSSDIFNSKFLPNETDNSLIDGEMPLVEIDGKTIVAGPNTPSEFTIEEKGGYAFNPEFLKRMEYDKLEDLSVLFPNRKRDIWEKISFDGASIIDDDEADTIPEPSPPKSLKADGYKISWDYTKGEMIVGYRIYYSPEEGKAFKLLDHTIKPNFTIPENAGIYHVKAVNYEGIESDPSKEIIVKEEEKDETDDKKPGREEEKPKPDEKPKQPTKPDNPKDDEQPEDSDHSDEKDEDEDQNNDEQENDE